MLFSSNFTPGENLFFDIYQILAIAFYPSGFYTFPYLMQLSFHCLCTIAKERISFHRCIADAPISQHTKVQRRNDTHRERASNIEH
jgi:hypothetical protein